MSTPLEKQLTEEEIKMKGHRRAFDSSDGILKLKAGIALTTKEKLMAHRTAVARKNKKLKQEHMDRAAKEFRARVLRKKRKARPTEQVAKGNKSSLERYKKSKCITSFFKKTLATNVKGTLKKHNLYVVIIIEAYAHAMNLVININQHRVVACVINVPKKSGKYKISFI